MVESLEQFASKNSFSMDQFPDPKIGENGLVILKNRYLVKSKTNQNEFIQETPKELFWRVASFIASADILYHPHAYDVKGLQKRQAFDTDILIAPGKKVREYQGIMDVQDDWRHVVEIPYQVPEGTLPALYRAWIYYSTRGCMKLDFEGLIQLYIDHVNEIMDLAKRYYNMMVNLEFLPNTPTLMNAGLDKPMLSGCFVLPINDNLDSIFDTIRDAAFIHKAGGGTGFSFSRIRPRGDVVDGRPGGASGPISFMKIFNTATGEIKQGLARRGANMGVLSVHHPDIMEFIDCKKPVPGTVYRSPDDAPFSNFNISVAITDEFMEALGKDDMYKIIDPKDHKVIKLVKAREIWNKIIQNAWEFGDPGVIFIDEMNRHNPTPHLGVYESTNPCGEQVLLPYESCNLGSINLNSVFKNGKVDYDIYGQIINLAVNFLNGVCDMNWFPLLDIVEMTKGNRKIGLGVMGFADLLCRMGIPYDSEDALVEAKKLSFFLTSKATEYSCSLAQERGTYPNNKSLNGPFNAATTTVAPTGTIGSIADVSAGIEPLFYLKYERKTFEGNVLPSINSILFEKIYAVQFIGRKKKMMDYINKYGSLKDAPVTQLFDDDSDIAKLIDLTRIFVTAHDIDYKVHVKMQAEWQKNIDASISKTINFPKDAKKEDIEQAFKLAHELKCKGITIYRDGSKDFQVIKVSQTDNVVVLQEDLVSSDERAEVVKLGQKRGTQDPILSGSGVQIPPSALTIVRDLPDKLMGIRYRIKTGCGNTYVMINEYEGKPVEAFVEVGKSGGCAFAFAHGLGRMTSIALRAGVSPEEIAKQLKNIQCNMPLSKLYSPRKENVSSCIDAIAITLREHMGIENHIEVKDRETRKECPECGGLLDFTEGCLKCSSCGYSKC